MFTQVRSGSSIFCSRSGAMAAMLAIACVLTLIAGTPQPAQAQTFKVLYSFSNWDNGWWPNALVLDKTGNIYGTTFSGGTQACYCGTTFELSKQGSDWTFRQLHKFAGSSIGDGAYPNWGLVLGADGAPYGTTNGGGRINRLCAYPGWLDGVAALFTT